MVVYNDEVDSFFHTPSKAWDKRVAFRIKDVSEMLGLPISTIGKLVRENDIRATKVGRDWLIRRSDLYKWWQRVEDASIVL